MMKMRLLSASAVGALTLLVLRVAALPSQLNRTPYHDATLGVDLLRVTFLQVPIWVFAASALVFAIVFWLSKKKISAE